MAYDTTEVSPRAEAGFSIGAVLARCVRTYRRRLIPFFLVTFAVAVPLEAADVIALGALISRNQMRSNPAGLHTAIVPAFALLLYVALYAAQSALSGAAYRDMSGTAPALGRSVRDGLIRLPIVMVAVVISWLIVVAGWAAFAFPGIIVFAMTAVTVPACVIERSGPFGAISRSAVLTRGHRWRVLAIYLVEVVGGYGGFMGCQVALEALLLPDALAAIILTILQAALIAFSTVLNTAVYFELRTAKEGNAIDALAAVFD